MSSKLTTLDGIAYHHLPSNSRDSVDIASDSEGPGPNSNQTVVDNEFPDRQHVEKSLLRKVDRRMSILVVIYILNIIDRSNAGAARLRGFEEDLHLEGQQFNTILGILYVGYAIIQVPSNILLGKIGRPSLYLPICMVIWGSISVLMGTVKGFIGAACDRFFLGFVEATFFPGALFLLSEWYKRRELGQWTAILICGTTVSNAFGSLLASAILDCMDGVMGQAAWRWLFYIEGSVTVIVAICAVFVLPDFPATSSSWLTAEEYALAQLRMEEDVRVGNEEDMDDFKGGESGLKHALSDWTVWLLALAMTSMNILLSFSSFIPTLSATLGYNSTVSLLICAPPWMFATWASLLMSRHSDHRGERFGHISFSLLVGIGGFLMAMATMNTVVRYFSLFLIAQSYTAFVISYAWISNSIPHSPSKRAVALAFINAFSSLGNAVGPYAWPKSWGPSYQGSCAISVGCGALCFSMLWIFKQHLMKLNREIEAKEIETGRFNGFTYLL